MSLKKRAVSGLLWTFTQQFSVQGINVITGIILARLLLPSDFGLIGMLVVFIAIGNTLMDGGMTSSLIRAKDADHRDYSTVFFINLIFSVFLYLLLFVTAPLIAEFYHQPVLTPVIRLYTVSFIIKAFVGVQTTKLTKEMRFKEQMLMQIPSTIVGGITGIVLAYKGFGVWSLVWMNLVQTTLFTIQHWIFSGWMPGMILDKEKLKYHFRFGYKLTFSGIIDTIYTNAYKIIIGKYFSASELGYYTQAKDLQSLPVNNISTALNKVTYPLFASIQDDDVRLKEVYQKLLRQVIFWVAPMMILGMVIAEPLFRLVLTPKWLPAVPYFQILCITGILYPFHVYNLNILNVKGRSDLFLKLEIVKKAFITIGIAISFFFGIYGLLIFQIISSVFAFGVNTWYSGKFINFSAWNQIKEVSPCIGIATLAGVVSWGLHHFLLTGRVNSSLIILCILLAVYGIVYGMLSRILRLKALTEFKQLILKR